MGHSQNIAVQKIFVQITGHRNGNYLKRGGMDPPAFLASTTRWWRSKEQGVGIATLRPTTAPTMSLEAPESSFGGLQEA